MPKRTVLVDVHNYRIPSELANRFDTLSAYKGQEIDVSDEEAARGEKLGSLGSPEQLAARETQGTRWTDEEIAEASPTDLQMYVQQNPDDHDRVLDIENQRPRPRKAVLEMTRVADHQPARDYQPPR